MSTVDKLNKLIETKEAIRQSIIAKGTDVDTDVPFSQYPSKIDSIETGSSEYKNPEFYELKTSGGTNYAGLFAYTSGVDLDLSGFDTSKCTDMKYAFTNCTAKNIDCSNWDTRNVSDMNSMFFYCRSLTSLDVSNFDTSNVKNMSQMFYYCNLLTSLDLSSFNTSNVTNMSQMFYYCNLLTSLDLSSFNTSNVTNMNGIFINCRSLTSLDISNWDTGKVTSVTNIFGSCNSLTSITCNVASTINKIASQLPATNGIIYTTCNLEDLNLSNIESKGWTVVVIEEPDLPEEPSTNNYSLIFRANNNEGHFRINDFEEVSVSDCTEIETNIYAYNHDNSEEDLNRIEFRDSNITDLVYLDTENINNIENMFEHCNNLKSLNLSNWDTTEMRDMNGVFNNCRELRSLDISSWDTSNVEYSDRMFESCENLRVIKCKDEAAISKIIMNDVDNLPGRNEHEKGVIICAEAIDTSAIEIVSSYNTSLNEKHWSILPYVKNKPFAITTNEEDFRIIVDTHEAPHNAFESHNDNFYTLPCSSPVEELRFEGSGLTNVIVNLPVGDYRNNLESAKEMFDGCNNLLTIELPGLVTKNVTNMERMFSGCNSVRSINMSNWDISNVTNMSSMFDGCSELRSLDISDWSINEEAEISSIFGSCDNLTYITCNVASTINKLAQELPFTLFDDDKYGIIYTTCNKDDLNIDEIEARGWTVISSYNE